jgi:hypothetical protein
MNLSKLRLLALILCMGFGFFLSLQSQESADFTKVTGSWDVEVYADGDAYYLTMELKVTEGKLEGTISESMGTFSDVPLTEITFDGENLNFQFTSPTPPDGLSRLVKTEFKLVEDKLDGVMIVEELGVTASASAKRKAS